MKWCFSSPKVPIARLSGVERTKLVNQEKVVNRIFKEAKPMNENVLAIMPVPTVIKDALPKCGRTSFRDDLYRMLSIGPTSAHKMFNSLSLNSENDALELLKV